jgi:plasmid stability protein
MGILNIRNLPDDVHARLRVRAARAGRSMEAEARAILTAAVRAEEEKPSARRLQGWVDELYGGKKPANVVATLLAERRQEASQE